jgi:hypothetical protein
VAEEGWEGVSDTGASEEDAEGDEWGTQNYSAALSKNARPFLLVIFSGPDVTQE